MRLLVGMDGKTVPGEGSMHTHTVVRYTIRIITAHFHP
jgi:hypothetical protein